MNDTSDRGDARNLLARPWPSSALVFVLRWWVAWRRSRATTWTWATDCWPCAPPTGTSSLQNLQVRLQFFFSFFLTVFLSRGPSGSMWSFSLPAWQHFHPSAARLTELWARRSKRLDLSVCICVCAHVFLFPFLLQFLDKECTVQHSVRLLLLL